MRQRVAIIGFQQCVFNAPAITAGYSRLMAGIA
jgi:hypothetical protein